MIGEKINRRKFLKLGSLTALSVPAVNMVTKIGDFEIVESQETYGGFYVRKYSPENPPYQIDESNYQRYDQRKAINPMTMAAAGPTALARTERQDTGFARYETALEGGAWTLANALGTDKLNGDGGLYSWQKLPNAGSPGAPDFGEVLDAWDYRADGLSAAQVSNIVKKTALFYGASMAGIANTDERWFYGKTLNIDMNEMLNDAEQTASEQGIELGGDGVSSRDVLLQVMLQMDKKALKQAIVLATEKADLSTLPEGVNAATVKGAPAGMLQSMLPSVVPTFEQEYMYLIANEIEPSEFPSDFDPSSLLEEEYEVVNISQTLPAGEIRFEDVEAPYCEEDGTQVIPTSMKHVIVMAFEMDPVGMTVEHGQVSHAAVANGYSRMAVTAASVANFIRLLGYNAIPMGNDTGLSVPMAIDAGLGELSRIGILVTPKYGPRVRLAKVLTDMPLQADGPITFGVTEFCDICGKCADSCPSGAIPKGERSFEPSVSSNPGVYKWAADGTKCLKFSADTGTGCSQCIVSCPFNKPEGWLHEATRILIGVNSGPIDQILLKLDDASGYGNPVSGEAFWQNDTYMHIK